jgi:hypothetical protein
MTLDGAIRAMQQGALLMLTHTVDDGDKWSVEPGGWVLPVTAARIIARDDVRPADDCLFTGQTPQSWRLIQNAAVAA